MSAFVYNSVPVHHRNTSWLSKSTLNKFSVSKSCRSHQWVDLNVFRKMKIAKGDLHQSNNMSEDEKKPLIEYSPSVKPENHSNNTEAFWVETKREL